jgi:hypothetical protein
MKLEPNITYCISREEVPTVLKQLTTDNLYFVSPIESLRDRIPKIKLQNYLETYLSSTEKYPGIYKDIIRFQLIDNYDDYQAIQLMMDALGNNAEKNFLDELKRHRRQTIRCE